MRKEDTHPSGGDRISIVAGAVRAAYGGDAVAVALRQIDLADGDTRDDWIAVLDHLRREDTPRAS